MRKYLIFQQGRTLGHATCSTARAKSTPFATECHQAFLVAVLAPYPQKSVFKPPALQVGFEFLPHIVRQHLAFSYQIFRKCGVIARYELIK
jgi:hypothetical protein